MKPVLVKLLLPFVLIVLYVYTTYKMNFGKDLGLTANLTSAPESHLQGDGLGPLLNMAKK